MDTNQSQLTKKLKSYHIILISILLGSFLILNSNYLNEKKATDKINKEKENLFNNIINNRRLEEEESTDEKKTSDNICKLGTADLRNYYKTGDTSKIGLKTDKIECKESEEDYMEALKYFAHKYLDDDKKNQTDGITKDTEEEEYKDEKEYIKIYIIHIIHILIFAAIAVLSIFGWIICGFCTCCNCCCCCCCKKISCKIPCFIFTYIFYAAAIIACIYGLTQSNKIFEGLADTECSVLKFIEQIIDGEKEEKQPPKWIGITGINGLLTTLKNQINELKDDSLQKLDEKISNRDTEKTKFNNNMKEFGDYFYQNGNYHEDFTTNFALDTFSNYKDQKFVLDIIKNLGHYDNQNNGYVPESSFLNFWKNEYSIVVIEADRHINTSKESFKTILKDNANEIVESLEKAENTFGDLKKHFNKINDEVGKNIIKYSEKVDNYGRKVVLLVFSVLMLINIVLAVLVLFIGLCSAKCCPSCCCCCRCLFKSFVHILWNILALMMILSFILGAILTLVGKVGEDGMSFVSYVASSENFESENPLLVDKLGDAKKYLNVCLHGDGSLENEFNINDSIDSINKIDEVLNQLKGLKDEFQSKINNLPSYHILKGNLTNRIEFNSSDISLFGENDNIILAPFLTRFNEIIHYTGESWSIDKDKGKNCDYEFDEGKEKIFNPLLCKPINRPWINELSDGKIKDYAIIISEMVDLTQNLNKGEDSFENKLENLNKDYNAYLDSYLNIIEFLNTTITSLIGELKDKVGNGNIFSFLNGHFISINLKIILKYLKHTLGEDFYYVGICFIIVGFSLILSISSTILLIVIINLGLEPEKPDKPDDQISFNDYKPKEKYTHKK